MIRRVLFELILFLLPFVLYDLYWRHVLASGKLRSEIAYPRILLTTLGLLLVAGTLVWWAIADSNPKESTYVPAHVEDGTVIPGHFDPAPTP